MSRFTLIVVMFCSAFVEGQVNAEPDSSYYETADQLSSQAMRDSLHEIIDDHARFPYASTATDTWDVLEIGDEEVAKRLADLESGK